MVLSFEWDNFNDSKQNHEAICTKSKLDNQVYFQQELHSRSKH
jgi:hypothetical protein